ncbi:hypothetical protein [uncultured Alistipes sp.]
MKVDALMLMEAEMLLNENYDTIARKQADVLNIGCSMCANCSGIVGD